MLKNVSVAVGVVFLCAVASLAQFSGSIQGTVTDPSGARITAAAVKLQNIHIGVSQTIQTNDVGYYRFLSLVPGDYEVTVTSAGFQTKTLTVQVTTGQSRDVDFSMQLQASADAIAVTGEAPVLDMAETRLQVTINQAVMRDLPTQGNNFLPALSLAPGITGTNGNTDNFTTGYQTGMSANGRSAAGNAFTLDGMNVESNIDSGCSNIMLNPDAIQEVTIETNSFKADQGIASSIVISIASKSGTNQFHGAGNYYFTNQSLRARTSLPFIASYAPFMQNNVSGVLGGPIVRNKIFFFTSAETLRSKTGSVSTETYESQELVAWAAQKYTNTVGTMLLKTYPTSAAQTNVLRTTQQVLGATACGPSSATGIPCDMPMLVQGTWNRSPFRNGLRWSIRGDAYVSSKDRFNAVYTRSDAESQTLQARPGFNRASYPNTSDYQGNWTHVFSSTTLSQFTAGAASLLSPTVAPNYRIPSMSITNVTAMGQGTGNTYGQLNINMREVLTLVRNTHTLNLGFTLLWADDFNFNPFGNRPTFSYNNLLEFVQDKIYSGGYGTYGPLTGKPKLFDMGQKVLTFGLFAQDEWKVRPNLNLTVSMRWDDFGNPVGIKGWSGLNPVFQVTNIFVAAGNTVDQQFANATIKSTNAQYAHRLNRNFSPRIGFAWSPARSGKTRVRGGIGLYYDWVRLGESVDRVNLNPPNYITPNFGQTLALKPPSAPLIGSGNDYSNFFGFNLPTLSSTTLDSRGGLVGFSSNVGGVDPNIKAPRSLNYMIGVDRELPGRTVVGAAYSGSYVTRALTGTDYNRYPGDLLVDGTLHRLNPSFGQMIYIANNDVIHYNGMILQATKGLGSRGTIQGSYTLSHTTDFYNGGHRSVVFDTCVDPRLITAFPADASWDIRHRVSALGVYQLPSPSKNLLVSRILGGWEVTTTAILQTATPFTFYNGNSFAVGGDYNADGYNYDLPNVPSGLPEMYGRSYFLGANAFKAAYTASQFTAPKLGTQGNSPRNAFRNQGQITVNASLVKNNKLSFINERWNLQLKLEAFNALNRVNLGGVTNNLGSATFGQIQSQGPTRFIQIGAHLSF